MLCHYLLNDKADYYDVYFKFEVLPIFSSLRVLIGSPLF